MFTGMIRAIDLLGDDFPSAKQAMKDYIKKYKVDHRETMGPARVLLRPRTTSLTAESELLARLEVELEGEAPSIPGPMPATQTQMQPAEDDFVGCMIAPAGAAAPQEVRPIAVQIAEYRQERSAPQPEEFQSIAYWERKLETWPQLARKAQRVLSRLVVSSATERLFSGVKWLEGLRRLRLTEGYLSDFVICNANFELAQALALDPIICLELFG
jgi:hypothetical protein